MSRFMPKTEREIARLGRPIPFPTTLDEYRDVLVWALDELHEATHARYKRDNPGLDWKPETDLTNTGSDWCRLRLALQDERFRCPDKWHLVYQPGDDACPTCGLDWIAPRRSR